MSLQSSYSHRGQPVELSNPAVVGKYRLKINVNHGIECPVRFMGLTVLRLHYKVRRKSARLEQPGFDESDANRSGVDILVAELHKLS